jgi:PAS domain S-box-containing protein
VRALRGHRQQTTVERTLRETETHFLELFEHTSDAVVIFAMRDNGSWACETVNPAFEQTCGIRAADCLGRGAGEFLPANSAEQLAVAFRACQHGRRVVRSEETVDLPLGRRWFDIVFVPLANENGRICRIVCLARDVTERLQTLESLRASEERRLVSVWQTPLGAIEWSPHGRVVSWNPAAEAIFGWSAVEAVGQHFWFLTPPELQGSADEIWHALLEQRGQVRTSLQCVARDGRTLDCEWYSTPLIGDDGRVSGVVSLVQDVTVNVRAAAALRESEARFRGFFELSLVGAAMADLECRWLEMNDRLCTMLGESWSDLKDRTWLALIHRDDRSPHLAQIQRILDRVADGYTLDARFTRKDGSTIHTAMNVGCVRKENGAVDHFILVLSDITERTAAEDAVRKLNAELEYRVAKRTSQLAAANHELEAFCYSVSHDLRAPLRAIDGFSQALLEDFSERLDSEGRDYLRRVRSASQRMGELIDALLKLSRVARASLQRTRIDLSSLVRGVAESLATAHADRRVEWFIEPDLFVDADRHLLAVLVENLLGNAFKYTSRKENARIEFGSLPGNGARRFFVKDDGAGFDMTYADKLFQPFQRLHRPDEFEGHGIGLATVQRIAQRHGGRAWAVGEPGKGATVYFELDA